MPDDEPIRVAVLCGDVLLAEGLRSSIFRAGLNLAAINESPSVVVADYANGLSLLSARSHRRRSDTVPEVVILSMRDSSSEIRHAIAAGALGYLTIDCSATEAIAAIRSAHKRSRYLSVTAAGRLADEIGCELLTIRELDVLRLLSEGHGNKDIAHELNVALGTVKSHVKAILHKLGATSRTGAAKVAERRGLLTAPEVVA